MHAKSPAYRTYRTVVALAALLVASGPAMAQRSDWAARNATSAKSNTRIAREVRHELVLLPYYGVFDNLAFEVNGETVTLLGQVTRPTLKSDAERAIKGIEGITRIVNKIEVLPPSRMDDQIRRAEFRTIYGTPGLERYGWQAVPSIHIIVSMGHVTLEGAVASEADRELAGLKANGVSSVFSVQNNLRVAP